MSTVSNNNILAQWLDDFVQVMNKKEMNKKGEININDLPKLVWKGETFHVLFDKTAGTATILQPPCWQGRSFGARFL
jgi:hypothetical protein